MNLQRRRPSIAVTLAVTWLVSIALQAGQRDSRSPAPAGTARISGVVLTTDDTPHAVRRAIVSLTDAAQRFDRHTITDDDGLFEFSGLPGGRYALSATRRSYVAIPYGATRPGRPGTPIALEAGDQLAGVRVRLQRGAVITGTVRDMTGEPVASLDVRIQRISSTTGAVLANTTAMTDDQGVFRAFGLPAGRYIVAAIPLTTGAFDEPSDAEVDAALEELRRRRSAGPQPPGAAAAMISTAAVREAASRASRSVPVYYPSSLAPEDASAIIISAGEERGGIDILVRMMSASAITGRVTATDARAMSTVIVTLARVSPRGAGVLTRSTVDPDGTFEFEGVAPGRYALTAIANRPGGRMSEPATPCAFAAEELLVTGTDLSGLSLVLGPCLTIEGRLEFAGTTLKPPADFNGARVTLKPNASAGIPAPAVPRFVAPVIRADGRFVLGELGDVLPGSYDLRVELPGNEPGRGWWLQSATATGRDILDGPLELTSRSPATTIVILTFTDRHTSLSGVLETPARSPAIEYTVIAFTTNRDWWRAPFRRVRTARPATNGQYLFQDLPPGEYYLAALTDLAPDDWRDPEFLAELVSGSVRVTIDLGEQKVQGLRIAGG
jgi:uncharacterized protein (DUF2141 family)